MAYLKAYKLRNHGLINLDPSNGTEREEFKFRMLCKKAPSLCK